MFKPLFLMLSLAVVLPSAVHAQALRGKSITVTWTETREQRLGGMGAFTSRATSQTLQAYVSETGRVFATRTVAVSSRKGRPKTATVGSVGSEAQGGGRQIGSVSGRVVTVTTPMGGGARMARIEVDPSGSSCSANVILGREGGKGIARGRSMTSGEALEIKSASVTNVSCAVRDGNAFAQ